MMGVDQYRLFAVVGVLCAGLMVSATDLCAAGRTGGPPAELADVTGYDEVGTGGIGPDVVGFRINMTPREVVEVIKKHPGLPYSHTFESTLAFRSVDHQQRAVAGGDFINFITAFNADPSAAARAGETMEIVTLAFTPVPGKGRVFGIVRQLTFPRAKQPEAASVAQSLIEKYGTPVRNGPHILMWSYDIKGKLLKAPAPGMGSINEQMVCVGYQVDSLALGPVGVSTTANDKRMHWNITAPVNPAIKYRPSSPYSRSTAANGWESLCGAIVVRATLQASGPLMHGLEIRVTAPDLVPPAQETATALIEASRKADAEKSLGSARKNKPAL